MQKVPQTTAHKKAAIREVSHLRQQERLPSGIPYPRPTRDVTVSNKSHSIVHEEYFSAGSQPKIMDRQAEEHEYEKQANIVYTRQFRMLAKLLGKETMDFDQLKDRVQRLLQQQRPQGEQQELKLRIHTLQRQLAKREGLKTSQFMNSQQEYTKQMQFQLDRKSKLISELSNSIKRQDFELAYRGLEREVSQKEKTLRSIEDQLQQAKVKSNSQITMLEEQIIKRNQTIQKLTFELDTLKRKHQSNAEETERLRKREKDLLTSLETETKVHYQGVTYSLSSLLLQLQSRDKELSHSLELQQQYEQQASRAQQISQRNEIEKHSLQTSMHQLQANINYYKVLIDRQNLELQQHRQEKQHLRQQKSQLQKKVQHSALIIQQLQQQEKTRFGEWQTLQNQNQQLFEDYQQLKHKYKVLELNELASQQQHRQLQAHLKEERDSHSATLLNFETIQEKMLEENEARHKLELLLAEQQQNYERTTAKYEQNIRQLQQQSQQYQQQKSQLNTTIQHLLQQSHQLKQTVQELNLQLINNKLNISNYEQNEAHLKQELSRLTVELEDNNSLKVRQNTIISDSQRLLETYQHEKIQLEQANQQLQQQINSLQQVIKHQNEAIQTYKSRDPFLQEYQTKITLLQAQIQTERTQSKQHGQLIPHLQQQLSNTQQLNEQLKEQLSHNKHQLEQYKSLIHDLQGQLQNYKTVEQQTYLLKNKVEQQTEQISHYQNQLQLIDQYKDKLTDLEEELSHYMEQEHKLKAALEQMADRENHLQAELENTHKEILQLKAQNEQERTHSEKERQESYHKIQMLNEHIEHERDRVNEQQRMRVELQKQLHQIQTNTKIVEQRCHAIETQAKQWKQKAQVLQHQLANKQLDLHNQNRSHQQEKLQLKTQIETLNHHLQTTQSQANSKHTQLIEQSTRTIQEKDAMIARMTSDITTLQHDKQELTTLVDELSTYKQKYLSSHSDNKPKHQLDSYSFNYYEANEKNNTYEQEQRDHQLTNGYQKEELVQRIQELQRIVDELKDELEDKSENTLKYSRSQEEQSLKLIVGSLQQEKEQVQHAMKELQAEILPKLQMENNLLKQKLERLTLQLQTRQRYNNLVSEHETRYQQLSQQLIRMDEQFNRIKAEQHSEQQKYHTSQSQYKLQIENLQRELSQAKSKEIELNNQILEIQILRSRINVLTEQIRVYRQECDGQRTHIKELQTKNKQHQQQIQRLLEEETNRDRKNDSVISKKSRQSSNISKKELQNQLSRQPSSDGELSQKILNYDPSKISGQESKFANLVFENSKIHIVRQAGAGPEGGDSRAQIKEQRHQESILSKNVHEKQKSVNDSSKRSTPKASEQVKKEEIVDLGDDASSVSSRQSQSIINRIKESTHSYKPLLNNNSKLEITQTKNQPKKQQYLPQQSSRKTVSSHLRESHKEPAEHNSKREQNSSNVFSKKIQIATISPIYVARETIIENRSDGSHSKSRSSSKNRVTITYGQPGSDRSLQLKKEESDKFKESHNSFKINNNQPNRQPEKTEFSIRGSHFGSHISPEHSINQISPVHHRQSKVRPQQTIRNSIYSSRQRPSEVKENPLKTSILQRQQYPQSQSVIHSVINCNSNQSLPQASSNFKPSPFRPAPTHYGYPVEHQNKNYQQQVQQSITSPVSPRASGVNFNAVRSSHHFSSLSQTSSNNFMNPLPPSQLTKTIQFVKQDNRVVSPQKSISNTQVTPLKVNMKKVAGGLRNTSAGNETATFGLNSSRLSNDSLSITEDSGIEVLQYNWAAPCCQMQP